jgi:hypothetical protein
MKTAYLLVIALAMPLVAGGQDTKTKDPNNLNVFVQDSPALNLLTTASADNDAFAWSVGGAQSGPKVDLDIRNAPVGEALKELFNKAKIDYKVEDKELPDNRVSLAVKQVSFSTALNLITQSAGLHYAVQVQDGKTTYRIGKKLTGAPYALFNDNRYFAGDTLTLTQPDPNLGIYKNTFKVNPQVWTNRLKNNTVKSLTLEPNAAWVYGLSTGENRSTFICPHCKGQVTVIRQRQLPKCPKCSRTFQGEWQFCPFDGAKRPAVAGGWKYCPICGKAVDMEKDEAKKTSDVRVPVLGDIPIVGDLFHKDTGQTPKE